MVGLRSMYPLHGRVTVRIFSTYFVCTSQDRHHLKYYITPLCHRPGTVVLSVVKKRYSHT